MKVESADEPFVRHLRQALRYLYDPARLRRNPLYSMFVPARQQSPATLRNTLVEAIEELKPAHAASSLSSSSRSYFILSQRYVQQFSQPEVAANLGLGIRQFRRHERLALQLLADILWSRHALAQREAPLPSPEETGPSREAELAWLGQTFSSGMVEVQQVVQAALRAARPLLASAGVKTTCVLPEGLPLLNARAPTVSQALLNVITAALSQTADGELRVEGAEADGQVAITVHTRRTEPRLQSAGASEESLRMAAQLLTLSGGVLEREERVDAFQATLRLPAAERAPVLVIDDNADTLRLFERHLHGTGYAFVGTREPTQAIELVRSLTPCAIVLDVMLPGMDGWELLGWLRALPSAEQAPIIVCTILPQEQVALALGAAAFLRKPVRRRDLLTTLNRLASPSGPAACSQHGCSSEAATPTDLPPA